MWPFKVAEGEDGKPQIVVKFAGQEKKFYPEEISAHLLTKLK